MPKTCNQLTERSIQASNENAEKCSSYSIIMEHLVATMTDYKKICLCLHW